MYAASCLLRKCFRSLLRRNKCIRPDKTRICSCILGFHMVHFQGTEARVETYSLLYMMANNMCVDRLVVTSSASWSAYPVCWTSFRLRCPSTEHGSRYVKSLDFSLMAADCRKPWHSYTMTLSSFVCTYTLCFPSGILVNIIFLRSVMKLS